MNIFHMLQPRIILLFFMYFSMCGTGYLQRRLAIAKCNLSSSHDLST